MDLAKTKKKVSEDWWKSEGGFFGNLYAEADDSYEGFLNKPQNMPSRLAEEVIGVINLCELKPKAKLLDAPCGYGRHSLCLTSKGIDDSRTDIYKQQLSF